MSSLQADEGLKTKNTLTPNPDEQPVSLHFSPKEEASLLAQSAASRATANTHFAAGDSTTAIQGYESALATCPAYLDYDVAVLRANIAACHLKLGAWKEAADAATEALEGLERVDPAPKVEKAGAGEKGVDGGEEGRGGKGQDDGRVQEVDEGMEERIEALRRTGRSLEDVRKIRVKALLRRARARTEIGGWAALQGAQEDYTLLSTLPSLTPLDRKTVRDALATLPPRLEDAKQKEMGEMLGKLKQLGNGILKPFGLSTDNFSMVKDEATGGYSMQFNQNR